MERAFILMGALLLNALFAGPKPLHDRLGITALLHKPAGLLRVLERKLNREHRSAEERKVRGALVVGAAFIAALICGLVGHAIFNVTSHFFEMLLLVLFFPVRASWDVAAAIRKALAENNLAAAQKALEGTLWRHHARLDEPGTARAAIEFLAVQFAEKILAPTFWFMVLGLPGLFFCVLVTLMQETLAPAGGDFGKPAHTAYKFMHWLPAKLAACLWIAASLFSAIENIKLTARTIHSYMVKETPQALQLACAATVLNLSLGGPSSAYTQSWVGSGTPKPLVQHIKTAQYLYVVLHLLLMMAVGLLM